MNKIELKALGKINLGLDVLGKRENGYHDVRMVMQTLYLYDQITITKKETPGIELKTNTAPMQRFVWSQGLGVVTKGLNEYEIRKNSLYITILRSTNKISEPLNPCRGTPAGPPLVCPDLQCLGKNNVQFAILFTNDAQSLYKTAEDFYGCVVAFWGNKQIEQIIDIDNKNILIQAVKLDKNENLVCRLVNISDEKQVSKIKIPEKYSKIYLTDICENNLKIMYKKLNFEPSQIITVKIAK